MEDYNLIPVGAKNISFIKDKVWVCTRIANIWLHMSINVLIILFWIRFSMPISKMVA